MALQLLTGVGASVSRELDVRSVGTRMVPFTIYVTGNNSPVQVYGSPTNAAVNYVLLGTIAAGGDYLAVDQPIDYIKVSTDPGETGAVNAFITTSR